MSEASRPSSWDPSAPLLALETASGNVGVALLRGEQLLVEVVEQRPPSAARAILPVLERALALAGLGIGDVGGFALAIGPGSFTGLRVGLATVKGLAFDPPRPVAAVSTLRALATGARIEPGEALAALLDARRGELYAAVYAVEPERAPACIPEGLYRAEELADRIPLPCCLVGDAVGSVWGCFSERFGSQVRRHEPPRLAPRPVDVARLGARVLATGQGQAAEEIQPRYLRRAQAEARRATKRDEGPASL